MLQSVLAVVVGPVVFGMVCVPSNWVVVKLFPSHFDEQWQTRHAGLLVLLVSLTLVHAGASGFAGGWIAKDRVMMHAAAMCVLQLVIGIAVQRQFWDTLPLWYHLAFFVLLVAGILLGAWLAVVLRGPIAS